MPPPKTQAATELQPVAQRYEFLVNAMTVAGFGILGVREFTQRASEVIRAVEETEVPLVITRHGRPVATMVPPTSEQRTAFVLAHAPRFVRAMAQTEQEAAEGGLKTLDELRQELSRGGGAKGSAARKSRKPRDQAAGRVAAKSAARRTR